MSHSRFFSTYMFPERHNIDGALLQQAKADLDRFVQGWTTNYSENADALLALAITLEQNGVAHATVLRRSAVAALRTKLENTKVSDKQ